MSNKRKAPHDSIVSEPQVKRLTSIIPSLSDRTRACNSLQKQMPSPSKDWQNIPEIIFGDIMMMLGMDKLEDIPKCSQVCRSWNMMISLETKHKKDTIWRNTEILADEINSEIFPNVSEILTAASLAHHGLLGSVERMRLVDVDLASVPTKHLAALASCVTKGFNIRNVTNMDLGPFLDNVKCKWLGISRQSLSSEETRALVRAMESHVESVRLGFWGEVTLDIMALHHYSSGQGRCRRVELLNDTARRYREEVRTWSRRINWVVKQPETEITLLKRRKG